MRVLLLGAGGAVGSRMIPLLVAAGHTVVGTTRKREKAAALTDLGAQAAVVDATDREALVAAVKAASPDVIVSQLSDLPQSYDPATFDAALLANSQLRKTGTANLVAAALAAGVARVISQSAAFAYAPGPLPHRESDPLDAARTTLYDGVATLERLVLGTPGVSGCVLRYGYFYGPGTWYERADRPPSVHVDAAAEGAVRAVERGGQGIYNLADDDGAVSIERASAELGWSPAFRIKTT